MSGMQKNDPAPDPQMDPRAAAEIAAIRATLADIGESMADFSKGMAELKALAARREKEAEADRKQAEENHAALDKKISDEVKQAEGFRDSLARAAEDAFAFRLADIMRDNYGIRLDEVLRRVQVVNHGREVDILGLNGSVAVVGEVKIRLKREDVLTFVGKLGEFRDDFPDHARETVYGVVAGETVDGDAAALARKRGFFVLRMDEGIVCPETPEGFRPRAY